MSDISLEDTFMQALLIVNPLATFSNHQRSYIEANFAKIIGHVPKDLAKKVLLWASTSKHKDVFLADHPVFGFLNAWNKISADYLHSINQPKTVNPDTESNVPNVAHAKSVRDMYELYGKPFEEVKHLLPEGAVHNPYEQFPKTPCPQDILDIIDGKPVKEPVKAKRPIEFTAAVNKIVGRM